jgi:putative hydrolase of the HAD superfamily
VTDPSTVLVLDLGGVAARWLPERRLAALSVLSGLPTATIDALVFESGFDDAGERGRFAPDEFRAHLRDLLGLPDGPEIDAALRAAWAQAYEPAATVLRVVARHPGPTALLTNNGPLLEEALAHELAPVGDAFDHVLISWRLGAAKPEPQAFHLATAALGVAPEQVLFADDSEVNVAAAREAGWRAIPFTTTLDLQAALTGA